MLKVRPAVAAVLPVLVLLTVAACSRPAPAPVIDRPPPGPADGVALAAQVEQAIGTTGTVMVTPDDEYPYPVFTQYSPASVAFVISAAAGPTPSLPENVISPVDIRFQSYRDGVWCVAANRSVKTLDRQWICARPGATDEFAKENAGSLKLELAAINPYSVVRVLTAASTVEVQAPQPKDGNTIRYRATLTPKAYLPLLTAGAPKQVSALLKGGVAETADLLLTPDDLPVSMTVTVPAVGRSVTQTFSDWGITGQVTTPDAATVIDSSRLDALLGQSSAGTSPSPSPSPTVPAATAVPVPTGEAQPRL